MINKRGNGFPWDLRESLIKMLVMIFTTSIGLWCGWNDTYGAFYIAVLVQAVNNMYEAFGFLKGFNKKITIFQLCSCLGAFTTVILSIIHFTKNGECVDSNRFVFVCCVLLSIPIIHYFTEIYLMLRKGEF